MNTTTTSRRSLTIAACILAVALSAWAFFTRTPLASISPSADSPPAAQAASGVARVQQRELPSVEKNIPSAKANESHALLTQYNSGDNVRALIAFALKHPEDGGSLYASRLLTQCRGVAQGTEILHRAQLPYAAGQVDYAQRAEAASRLSRRCAGLLPEEIDIARDKEILVQGEAQGDPLVRALRAYSTATQGFSESANASEARRAAMVKLLDTQDPLLIEDLGMRMSMYVDASTGRKYFWFAGRTYPLDSDVDVGGAFYLLPCGLGMTCDATEFTTAMRCASGEGCDASRFEYLRRTLETRPGAYDKALALYSTMLEAVKSKNVNAFVR